MVVPSPTFLPCQAETGVQSRADLAKAALRRTLRAARRDHVAALPAAMSRLVFNRPPRPVVDWLGTRGPIGFYHAMGAEAPTLGWIRWFHENGGRIALPWFERRSAAMAFREWSDPWDDDLLEPAPYGGLQPLASAPLLDPAALVVPLVGFTADGGRLGQGGGHYDRWLGDHPAVDAIGLAWDVQQVDELPLEPHDRPLAAVVTPTRIYWSEN